MLRVEEEGSVEERAPVVGVIHLELPLLTRAGLGLGVGAGFGLLLLPELDADFDPLALRRHEGPRLGPDVVVLLVLLLVDHEGDGALTARQPLVVGEAVLHVAVGPGYGHIERRRVVLLLELGITLLVVYQYGRPVDGRTLLVAYGDLHDGILLRGWNIILLAGGHESRACQ